MAYPPLRGFSRWLSLFFHVSRARPTSRANTQMAFPLPGVGHARDTWKNSDSDGDPVASGRSGFKGEGYIPFFHKEPLLRGAIFYAGLSTGAPGGASISLVSREGFHDR